MYDPSTARFLQEDTYAGDRTDPLSLNLCTYCHNEPLMYSDPTGHVRVNDMVYTSDGGTAGKAKKELKGGGNSSSAGAERAEKKDEETFGGIPVPDNSAGLIETYTFLDAVVDTAYGVFTATVDNVTIIVPLVKEGFSLEYKEPKSEFYYHVGRTAADVASGVIGAYETIVGAAGLILSAGGGIILTGATGGIGAPILAVAAKGALASAGVMAHGISVVAMAGDNLSNDWDMLRRTSTGGGGNNAGDFKKYTPEQIEKYYGLEKGQFHREVKDDILSDLAGKNSPYKDQMKRMGNNPDIYLTPDGQIQIVSREFGGKSFATDLNIKDFLP